MYFLKTWIYFECKIHKDHYVFGNYEYINKGLSLDLLRTLYSKAINYNFGDLEFLFSLFLEFINVNGYHLVGVP